jgi:hypothetical protein
VEALGLQDLRANQSEGVHGGGLKLAAPFPAAKACVPRGDERDGSVATATGSKVFMVYALGCLGHGLACCLPAGVRSSAAAPIDACAPLHWRQPEQRCDALFIKASIDATTSVTMGGDKAVR